MNILQKSGLLRARPLAAALHIDPYHRNPLLLNRQCLQNKIKKRLFPSEAANAFFQTSWSYYASDCKKRIRNIRRGIWPNIDYVTAGDAEKSLTFYKDSKYNNNLELDTVYEEFLKCFYTKEPKLPKLKRRKRPKTQEKEQKIKRQEEIERRVSSPIQHYSNSQILKDNTQKQLKEHDNNGRESKDLYETRDLNKNLKKQNKLRKLRGKRYSSNKILKYDTDEQLIEEDDDDDDDEEEQEEMEEEARHLNRKLKRKLRKLNTKAKESKVIKKNRIGRKNYENHAEILHKVPSFGPGDRALQRFKREHPSLDSLYSRANHKSPHLLNGRLVKDSIFDINIHRAPKRKIYFSSSTSSETNIPLSSDDEMTKSFSYDPASSKSLIMGPSDILMGIPKKRVTSAHRIRSNISEYSHQIKQRLPKFLMDLRPSNQSSRESHNKRIELSPKRSSVKERLKLQTSDMKLHLNRPINDVKSDEVVNRSQSNLRKLNSLGKFHDLTSDFPTEYAIEKIQLHKFKPTDLSDSYNSTIEELKKTLSLNTEKEIENFHIDNPILNLVDEGKKAKAEGKILIQKFSDKVKLDTKIQKYLDFLWQPKYVDKENEENKENKENLNRIVLPKEIENPMKSASGADLRLITPINEERLSTTTEHKSWKVLGTSLNRKIEYKNPYAYKKKTLKMLENQAKLPNEKPHIIRPSENDDTRSFYSESSENFEKILKQLSIVSSNVPSFEPTMDDISKNLPRDKPRTLGELIAEYVHDHNLEENFDVLYPGLLNPSETNKSKATTVTNYQDTKRNFVHESTSDELTTEDVSLVEPEKILTPPKRVKKPKKKKPKIKPKSKSKTKPESKSGIAKEKSSCCLCKFIYGSCQDNGYTTPRYMKNMQRRVNKLELRNYCVQKMLKNYQGQQTILSNKKRKDQHNAPQTDTARRVLSKCYKALKICYSIVEHKQQVNNALRCEKIKEHTGNTLIRSF